MRALVAIIDLERFEGKRWESKLISSSITLKSVATASLIRSHVNRLARKQRSSLQKKGLKTGLLVATGVTGCEGEATGKTTITAGGTTAAGRITAKLRNIPSERARQVSRKRAQ